MGIRVSYPIGSLQNRLHINSDLLITLFIHLKQTILIERVDVSLIYGIPLEFFNSTYNSTYKIGSYPNSCYLLIKQVMHFKETIIIRKRIVNGRGLSSFFPLPIVPRALSFSFSPVPLQHKDASVVETVVVLKSVPRVQPFYNATDG